MESEFSQQIFVTSANISFKKIRLRGAELFYADEQTDRQTDRQTDMAKPIVTFRNFANAPKYQR
jgi:hypothetical protein